MYDGFIAGDPNANVAPTTGQLRAIFVDRDGTLNATYRHPETGFVDSPMGPEEFEILPGAIAALRMFNKLDFLVIVVSNQPVVAKGKSTIERVEATTRKLREAATSSSARIDDVYYCLHHPRSIIPELLVQCACRKPGAGLIRQAAMKHDIDLGSSFMIGDSLTDIEAGHTAGCATIWIAGDDTIPSSAELPSVSPRHRVTSLIEAAHLIAQLERHSTRTSLAPVAQSVIKPSR